MTDKPNKARKVRRGVTASLIPFALSLTAPALLAGCKSSSPRTEPENGYLYLKNDSVIFLEWRRKPQKIIGFIEEWDRKPDGEIDLTTFSFDWVLDGENFRITLNSTVTSELESLEMKKAIVGTLRGNTLELPLVDGAGPIEFRRASMAEYSAAYRNLITLTTSKKGAAK
jgi:hypothetical protein